ncbi:protein NLP9-like [Vicia villosa]|uniref:protein NLP9-like n=1 Tax=Vicia villosa TaxID=3911 RepID=UPI00273AF374|nr:protein NLP9-like [Vicia villosa]XP_058780275.1 protein NLP9-like [Vicia villosa]
MEYPFYPKGRGFGYWQSPGTELEGLTSLDGGIGNLASEDMPSSFSELMNFDNYAGLYSGPSMTDQIMANEIPSLASVLYQSPDGFSPVEQNCGQFYMTGVSGNYNNSDGSPVFAERVVRQKMDTLRGFLDNNNNDANNLSSKQKIDDSMQHVNTLSLDEKMLKALSFFKESAGGGILAQVWVPIKHDGQIFLSTSEQPYLLDQMLAGYREVSRTFIFSTEGKPGCLPGLPGRVFISKVPEWTSNVGYYNPSEYLRVEQARSHDVRGSIAFPIFDLQSGLPCCAVLELVTTKEKLDFDRELEIICRSLQLVNLRTTMPIRLLPECLSTNKRAALTEIIDVLRSVCHAHRLPMALTWIPCFHTDGTREQTTRIQIKEGNSSSKEKSILCIEESACYITDRVMEGFVRACIEHPLEEGKGVAGKALQSHHPYFYSDVKTYDISEYPLVHHARKFNLNAAVAIRLRSIYTNDDDYILEFFLPINMKGSSEQQLLLDNLSGTMQRICKSLRTVSGAELSGIECKHAGFRKKKVLNFPPSSMRNSQMPLINENHSSVQKLLSESSDLRNNGKEPSCNQEKNGSRKRGEKSRSTSEKKVSLSVLQQYFSGSLKDAAKSIGVCPTTLKRICRHHGISRWPSRKINKVNRSLKKIQTVLDSVQGVEGGLKFDPTMGAFVAGGTTIQEIDESKNLLFPEKSTTQDSEPISEDAASVPLAPCSESENSANKLDRKLKGTNASMIDCSEDSKSFAMHDFPEQACFSSVVAKGNAIGQRSSFVADDMDSDADGDDEVVERNNPTSSSLTDSSSGSGSIMHESSSSYQNFENQKQSKAKSTIVDSGTKITVKATYGEDTIRFKFDPSTGCFKLYEEVATRFKLQYGTFQLKYLDDEEEWVMLVNDSDLQECLEILDDMGTRNARFLVRDMPCILGSSGSNSCYLGGSS